MSEPGRYVAYTLPQVLGNSAKANGCVGTDAGLFIIGGPCQEFEQLAINNPITELVDNGQDSLDGLLSNDGGNISETGSLDKSQKDQNAHGLRRTHHLRKDFVIDNFLGEIINH